MAHLTATSDCGLQKPAVDYCDPKITSVVEEVYEAVWALIQNADPTNGAKTICERKAELSRTIGALVVDGVTDPAELRDRALARITVVTENQSNDGIGQIA